MLYMPADCLYLFSATYEHCFRFVFNQFQSSYFYSYHHYLLLLQSFERPSLWYFPLPLWNFTMLTPYVYMVFHSKRPSTDPCGTTPVVCIVMYPPLVPCLLSSQLRNCLGGEILGH